jgi:hypothetical protein
VAGPQLLIGDYAAVRCLNLRTEMVTTIAGAVEGGRLDGPASRARFMSVFTIAVAPNGAVLVADRANECMRRISAAAAAAAPGRAYGDDADWQSRAGRAVRSFVCQIISRASAAVVGIGAAHTAWDRLCRSRSRSRSRP